MANKFTHPDKLIQKNLNNTPFDNRRNNKERENKSIKLNKTRKEIEKRICFKRMFTMLVASLLFAPAIALSHCYFGFLIYILSIVLILYTIFIYYVRDGQVCDG